MERTILCRSPRGRQNRVILRIIIASLGSIILPLCSAQPIYAVDPPTVVIEDTITLGVGIKTVEFDTTHFGEPSLLAGTVKSGSGDCFVLRVRTNPLEIAETLYTGQSVPLLVRAGRLDADEFADLLVSLQAFCPNDSPSYASVVLHGPDYVAADTLCFRSYLRDAIIEDSSQETWLAYSYDSSWTVVGFPTRYYTVTAGAVLHRSDISSTDPQDSVFVGGVKDIDRNDVDRDGTVENIVFWAARGTEYAPGEPGYPTFARFGAHVLSPEGDQLLAAQWWFGYGLYPTDVGFQLMTPVAVVDVDGDSGPEAITASYTSSDRRGVPGRHAVTARSLMSMDSVWSRDFPPNSTGRAPTAAVWELDSADDPDILVSHKIVFASGYDTDSTHGVWGLKGSTGDSLFYFESLYHLDPVVVGTLDNTGKRKGILLRADTLFAFYLDFSPTGVDDDGFITPAAFKLLPNYPNPFNAQTRIEYEISRPAHVTLNVYDILGRYVTTLIDAPQTTGQHDVIWSGHDFKGISVSSGVYFYRMKSDDAEQARTMLLLK